MDKFKWVKVLVEALKIQLIQILRSTFVEHICYVVEKKKKKQSTIRGKEMRSDK
jgi:hypothetical protein